MRTKFVCLLACVLCVSAAPLTTEPSTVQAAPATAPSELGNMDLSLTVFDASSSSNVDETKSYIILAFDETSRDSPKLKELQNALNEAVGSKMTGDEVLTKHKDQLVFGKANKDDFPDHKADFEKAKVPLPAILFWPAGHSRPSCKFDTASATGDMVAKWMSAKLKEEDEDDLLELDEGDDVNSATIEDVSLLVCQADGGPNVVAKEDPSCSDLMEGDQGLMQLEKTQKVWDFKNGQQKFVGPADNSLPHTVNKLEAPVTTVDSAVFKDLGKKSQYSALYFSAPWCHYCECLGPVWDGVSGNLVGSQRQPNLVVGAVDGDANPELRTLFNVTVYPTFLVVNKEGTKVLGRYLGPRKVFELSNWIEDLIVADENPVVKHKFDSSEQGEHTDMHPVYPYTGPKAFGEQLLVQLSGNDFDVCVDSDEAKFTAPGAALLVHYDSPRSLEYDGDQVNTEKVPEKPMVVDFYAPWCPHCQKLNPVWDAVTAKENDQGVTVAKVNVENHPDVKKAFGIHRFPTIMYFPAGEKMHFDESRRYTGQRDAEHLEKWIDDVKAKK